MTHETIRGIFLDGHDYRGTAQYDFMIRGVEQGSPELAYGCRSSDEVDVYFETLVEAFESMRDRGFLTQRELGGNLNDEIKLYLTRDGGWCHGNGGNHRIRIAELLGIEWVPFVLAGAHSEWVIKLSRDRDRPPRAAILEWIGENERLGTLRRHPPAWHFNHP